MQENINWKVNELLNRRVIPKDKEKAQKPEILLTPTQHPQCWRKEQNRKRTVLHLYRLCIFLQYPVACICRRYGCLLGEEWEGAGLVAFSCLGLRADTPCKPEITLQVINSYLLGAVIFLSKRPASHTVIVLQYILELIAGHRHSGIRHLSPVLEHSGNGLGPLTDSGGLVPARVFFFIPVPVWPDAGQTSIPASLHAHNAGEGEGYTLHVHTANSEKWYNLLVHTASSQKGYTLHYVYCSVFMLVVERIHSARPTQYCKCYLQDNFLNTIYRTWPLV